MPRSVQPQLLTSLHVHLTPALTGHIAPLDEIDRVKLGPPAMISYKNIYQTDKTALDPESESGRFHRQWRDFNEIDGWTMRFMNDTQGDDWVRDNFGTTVIRKTWDDLHRGVLKADLLRYLLILLRGGVYSDVDVSAADSPASPRHSSPSLLRLSVASRDMTTLVIPLTRSKC